MNKKRLLSIFASSLLGIFMLNSAFAHCEHCDDNISIVYGKPSVLGVQVKTDQGFAEPVIGVTDDSAILYNIPADGSDPVPLREVPTLYITDGPNPVVIDESISADNMMRGLVYPGDPNPVTLGDWLEGDHSKLRLTVSNDGMSRVKMRIKGLLPNSLYGVWQFNQAGGAPGPFGGIPNVLMTDHRGNATMQRTLPFNMMEIVDRLAIVYHSDHRIYGGTPSVINPFGGHDIHVQLEFNIQEAQ